MRVCTKPADAHEVVKRIPEVICSTEKKMRDLCTKVSQRTSDGIEWLKEKLESACRLVMRVVHQA